MYIQYVHMYVCMNRELTVHHLTVCTYICTYVWTENLPCIILLYVRVLYVHPSPWSSYFIFANVKLCVQLFIQLIQQRLHLLLGLVRLHGWQRTTKVHTYIHTNITGRYVGTYICTCTAMNTQFRCCSTHIKNTQLLRIHVYMYVCTYACHT